MDNNGEVVYLYLDDIIPNRFQPREVFDDQALKELAVSIKEHGVIQPIIVRKVENKYEIIAGERRYKASTMAGLTKIPAIVKNLDDKESSKVALIENLQRKDLSPIEEARTYQKILELEDSMTQEQLAATLGKTQSSVSNKLRLLELPEEIQDALLKDKISERHARSLLSVEDKNEQIKLMDKVIAEKMTVRDLDKEIKIMKEGTQAADQIVPQETLETNTINDSQTNTNISVPEINLIKQQSTPVDETTAPNNEKINNNIQEDVSTPTNGPQLATFNNITSVDIDKIRENSTDIGNIARPGIVANGATNNTENSIEQNKEEFNFVPSFGSVADTSNNVVEVTSPQETSGFAKFFSDNTSQSQIGNDTIASSIATSEIAVPSVMPEKDVTQAVTKLKDSIKNLQNDGYNVIFEEVDNPSDYKITIQINKN